MPKNSSNIDFFKPIQNFLLETLRLGHSKMITDMPEKFIQGFEWNSKFSAIETNDLNLFIHKNTEIPQPSNCPLPLSEANLSQLIKQLIPQLEILIIHVTPQPEILIIQVALQLEIPIIHELVVLRLLCL
jgi:hypothetical protein